jgi:hypothetical protein
MVEFPGVHLSNMCRVVPKDCEKEAQKRRLESRAFEIK